MTIYSPFTVHRSGRAALTFTLVLIGSDVGVRQQAYSASSTTSAHASGNRRCAEQAAGSRHASDRGILHRAIDHRARPVRCSAMERDGLEQCRDQQRLRNGSAQGTQRITPQQTTSYILTASGPGGDASRTATVTVTGPPPPPTHEHQHDFQKRPPNAGSARAVRSAGRALRLRFQQHS